MSGAWRPCEHPPRVSGWCFVVRRLGLITVRRLAWAEVHCGGEVYWREGPERAVLDGVTHWMPVPFPPLPKEETMNPPRARLVDGRIVTLPQDCGCLDHVGPHWLAWDARRRAENRAALCAAINAMGQPG